jgi:hypothetical protein
VGLELEPMPSYRTNFSKNADIFVATRKTNVHRKIEKGR